MNLYFTIKDGHVVKTTKRAFESLPFKYQDTYAFEKDTYDGLITTLITVYAESYEVYILFEEDDVWEELIHKADVDDSYEYYLFMG